MLRLQNWMQIAYPHTITTLNQHGLDPKCIVSQGYDGASVMSGRCSGVRYAHCLNLALVDTSRSITEACDFFALMELLYIFVSNIKVPPVYLEK